MKITLLAFILFTTFSFGQAIKFPYSFKMKHTYQECSECQNIAYHRWSVLAGQNFSSPLLKDAAEKKAALKNYSERMKNTFSGTLSPQDQAETECQMTRTGKHAWLEKSNSESSQVTQSEFNDEKKIKDEENQATIIQEKKDIERNNKIETIRLKSIYVQKLMEEASSSTTITEKIVKYENVVKENLILLQLSNYEYIYQNFYIQNLTSLSWYFIINKEYEKAYQLVANYLSNKRDFGTSGNYDNDAGVLINFSHAILFSNRKLDEFWEVQKIGCNYWNWYKSMSIDFKDLKEKYNISDPRTEEITTKIEDLYVQKFKRVVYVVLKAFPLMKSLGQELSVDAYSILDYYIISQIENSTRGFNSTKIEDNLYSIIVKKCMFFYCYDEDGNVQILNGCKENIKEKKLALTIEETKKIKFDNLKTKADSKIYPILILKH
jgi:hypothetical protein